MEHTSHLQSPGFSFKRRAGARLPPRHEREGFVPDPPAASKKTPLLPGRPDAVEHMAAVQRMLDTERASEEARSRVSVPNESPGERLWRMLGRDFMIQWSPLEGDGFATFSTCLIQTFGNAFYPAGITLKLKRGESSLSLRPRASIQSPNWVYTPKAAPDMRSVLFIQTELHPELIALCESGPVEDLQVTMRFARTSQDFLVSKAGRTPRLF
ncbi:hypothetical protein M0Q28_04360 [Patescibacteria group bacterium]|jgi:hypothetical protein|nr:hypothetical protein [Patescibacteria group bacterium]